MGLSTLDSASALWLDLANTIRAGAGGSEVDLLDTPSALGRWVAERVGDAGDEVLLRLPEFRALRAAVRELLAAAAVGEPLPPEAVSAVNRASAALSTFPSLDVSDPSTPTIAEEGSAASGTTRILALVARSAISTLGGEERRRIGRCPAPRCGRFFPAGRAGQVWCSAACGNRARVARHHARRRGVRADAEGTSPPA